MSRAEFNAAMSTIKGGWTQDRVRELLGPPDDIWPANDSKAFVTGGYEIWCYGTNGHHTFPTRGQVAFKNGKTVDDSDEMESPAPPPTLPLSEEELADALRVMDPPRRNLSDYSNDSQHLLAAANMLIAKGQKKAMAILEEYVRLSVGPDWLFWLVRVAFTSKTPGGVFKVPAIGGIAHSPPHNLKAWPTFPVALVDNVPICPYRFAHSGGVPEMFAWYMADHKAEWVIRKKPLIPPADPFPIYTKLLATKNWDNDIAFRIDYAEKEREKSALLKEFLNLVRTAYRPTSEEVKDSDFEDIHSEFLKANCHWDTQKQMYIRADGVALLEKVIDYAQNECTINAGPRLTVSFKFDRTDPRNVSYSTGHVESGTEPLPTAVWLAEDASTGNLLRWQEVTGDVSYFPWQSDYKVALAAKPHQPTSESGSSSAFFCREGTHVRFAVLFDGKRYESPVFTP